MSAELVDHVFLPAFADATLGQLGDSAVLDVLGGRLAFSTDSFVVRPLFFPGGSIGDLAVNGTVNDLAMSGAQALFLSAAFILEEGTDITQVGAVAERLGAAARAGRCPRRHRRHQGRRVGSRRRGLRQHRRRRPGPRRGGHPARPGPAR